MTNKKIDKNFILLDFLYFNCNLITNYKNTFKFENNDFFSHVI
jgi:hypothetical protein